MDFENAVQNQPVRRKKKSSENVLLGLIGAMIGAAIGGASIILLSQLGIIASFSGAILAVCTLLGYEVLGKELSTKGIVICVILMVITPFIADWIDWAIYLMRDYPEYGLSLVDSCTMFGELLFAGYIDLMEYLMNLGKIYLFVALGAIGTIMKIISDCFSENRCIAASVFCAIDKLYKMRYTSSIIRAVFQRCCHKFY